MCNDVFCGLFLSINIYKLTKKQTNKQTKQNKNKTKQNKKTKNKTKQKKKKKQDMIVLFARARAKLGGSIR